jgi:hypothetical protein
MFHNQKNILGTISVFKNNFPQTKTARYLWKTCERDHRKQTFEEKLIEDYEDKMRRCDDHSNTFEVCPYNLFI